MILSADLKLPCPGVIKILYVAFLAHSFSVITIRTMITMYFYARLGNVLFAHDVINYPKVGTSFQVVKNHRVNLFPKSHTCGAFTFCNYSWVVRKKKIHYQFADITEFYCDKDGKKNERGMLNFFLIQVIFMNETKSSDNSNRILKYVS